MLYGNTYLLIFELCCDSLIIFPRMFQKALKSTGSYKKVDLLER